MIIQEEGLVTYFEDTWIKERERRHSIEKEIEIKESDMYKRNKPPPLFYGDYHKHCTVLKFLLRSYEVKLLSMCNNTDKLKYQNKDKNRKSKNFSRYLRFGSKRDYTGHHQNTVFNRSCYIAPVAKQRY